MAVKQKIAKMKNHDVKRVSRLTAMVTQLQTKRIVTAAELTRKFEVSIRTIYRDIKALERANVPILTEEGKGYTLMDGYKVPPIMFTETEVNAFVTAEQLILKSNDVILIEAYTAAISKIKAVLQYSAKEKVDLLSNRIAISPAFSRNQPGHLLTTIQQAITDFKVLEINYPSSGGKEYTKRSVEPFALYYSLEEKWLFIAYCRLRKDFRMFRLDRIIELKPTGVVFEPHQLTLTEYLEQKKKNFSPPDILLS